MYSHPGVDIELWTYIILIGIYRWKMITIFFGGFLSPRQAMSNKMQVQISQLLLVNMGERLSSGLDGFCIKHHLGCPISTRLCHLQSKNLAKTGAKFSAWRFSACRVSSNWNWRESNSLYLGFLHEMSIVVPTCILVILRIYEFFLLLNGCSGV